MTRKPEPRPGDILDALNELGLISASQAKVSGNEVYVLCPYHEDRSLGSFSINIETGQNSCFSCGNGGSFHRYLMASQGMGRQQARRWCLNRLIATVTAVPEHVPGMQPEVTEASLALFADPPDSALFSRGITLESCQALGILWDAGRGMWIFPVRDPDAGQLLGWQEKGPGWTSNKPDDVPLKSCLFGWELTGPGEQVVLVESPLDTAVMADAGFTAVSSFGSVVTDSQLALITGRCSSLVLALDDDKAGWAATDRIVRSLHGIPVRVFNYGDHPQGKDPGELEDAAIQQGMAHLLC